MSAENRLNASEANVAAKGGKRGTGGIENKGGIGDRRDLLKRHQSFARTLT